MNVSFTFLKPNHPEWETVAHHISSVSWKAGNHLASKMKKQEFSDWEAVLIGSNNDNTLVSFCTINKTDSLPTTLTPFIGYVFVSESFRGQRLSEKMLKHAEEYLAHLGFISVYLQSGEIGLYEKFGYKKSPIRPVSLAHEASIYQKNIAHS